MRNSLRLYRVEKGYTQKQFAELLEITETQYQRIESGTSEGSIKTWLKIKRLLAQPIDSLIEDT